MSLFLVYIPAKRFSKGNMVKKDLENKQVVKKEASG